MSFRRKLTADGPHAAYEAYHRSQRPRGDGEPGAEKAETENSSSGIARTVNLDSSGGHDERPVAEVPGPVAVERPLAASATRERSRTGPGTGRHVSATREPEPDREDAHHEAEEFNRPRSPPRSAHERIEFKRLKQENLEYKQTVATLRQAQTSLVLKHAELPRHCQWICVSKVLTDVVSSLLLGSSKECNMYPAELEIIPKILLSFGITMEQRDQVEPFLVQWGKGGEKSIMNLVYNNIRDRRGAVLRVLREEFYKQLEVPKPHAGGEVGLAAWQDSLVALRRSREWRTSFAGEVFDPWGTDAVHHSIARVINGMRFDPVPPVTLSVFQAGFLFYNLELAMEGRVMEAARMHLHHRGMQDMEKTIRLHMKDMKRIIIVL